MAEQSTQKAQPKMTARFFARSAARLERLLIINAPQPIVENELKTARNRLVELEAAFGVAAAPAPCAETYAGCAPDCHAGNRCTDGVPVDRPHSQSQKGTDDE